MIYDRKYSDNNVTVCDKRNNCECSNDLSFNINSLLTCPMSSFTKGKLKWTYDYEAYHYHKYRIVLSYHNRPMFHRKFKGSHICISDKLRLRTIRLIKCNTNAY